MMKGCDDWQGRNVGNERREQRTENRFEDIGRSDRRDKMKER